jgi:hypothetical protein
MTKNKSAKKSTKSKKSTNDNFSKYLVSIKHYLWRDRSRFGKIMVISGFTTLILLSTMFGIAQWYIQNHKNKPLVIGTTFIPNYARYFGLDPKETLQATIDDLGIRRFRLVSYWKNHEPTEDNYDFTELDWQFDMIEKVGGEVSLTLGLRQPRWPECHGPDWAMEKPIEEWSQDLNEFMGVVIDRYKDRPSLIEYQLENEYFLSVFGECPDHSRERLVNEFNYVKSKDPTKPLIVSRSNNATPSWPIGEPRADLVAASIYKRVYDKTVTRRYFEYPYPAWFYGFLAGATMLTTDRDTIIHELQTEAWLPEPYEMKNAPIDELYKTFGPDDVASRLKYGVDTGIRTIDIWGVEWWYQMKTQRNAPEIWDLAKEELEKYRN